MVMMMADDRDLIIGELREATRSIKEHLRRQDDAALVRDQQKEVDKREAIKAREEKDARDEARFRVLDEKSTLTGGRVSVLEDWKKEHGEPLVKWHEEEGAKLGSRVSILEQIKNAEAAAKAQADLAAASQTGERRGRAAVWALIGSAILMVGGLLGWLGADKLSAILFNISVRLGGHG